ncbi:hypothetical protein MPC4_20192 [Methylocella tundrae]|uniref:Uncharacterized protein n=1 Tax=Methylocella tundrae TaxID=227605 RepID=A0A8B6M6N0_METTU|nr:hypothetical protein MPC4_20192 [Methylocella tundrae]
MSLPGRLTAAGQSGVARMRLAPSSLGAPGALRCSGSLLARWR